MAHIFISYSKKDIVFARYLRSLLQDRGFAVWMDDTKLAPSEHWWPTIERNIVACSAFIIVMSPDSRESKWVEREILYAEEQEPKKPIFPILLAGKRWSRLADIQYEDMTAGTAATLTPQFVDALQAVVPAYRGEPLPPPLPEEPVTGDTQATDSAETRKLSLRVVRMGTVVAAILLIGLILVLTAVVLPSLSGNITPTRAALQSSVTPALAPTQTIALPTPTVPTPTEAPTLDVVYIVQTLDAQGTAAARLTYIAATTALVRGRTQTATLWTPTPTPTRTPSPNITASIDAFRTQRAASVTVQYAVNLTATATRWTPTPTRTPTRTPTFTPTLTDEQRAITPVTRNADWKPVIRDFNGVKMALVPAGCFTMGTEAGIFDEEKPTTKICFDKPFWIDQTEVTNAQFAAFNGQAAQSSNWTDANRPRERITWFEARDFCVKRGARLPTEAEWEYAARGPDNLVYPWGNSFDVDNVVNAANAHDQTANVGSKPGGASWIGALDMSGNVSEWVSTIYRMYPYDPEDGRENNSDTYSSRALRGGGWLTNESSIRSADRGRSVPAFQYMSNGFRCARSS